MKIYEVAFHMPKQNVKRQQETCQNVECYKLPAASTCCLLPLDMLLVWTGLYAAFLACIHRS